MASKVRFSKPYLLLSTTSSRKNAEKIAHVLIQEKLAACVNIIPNVGSIYRWRGTIDQARELLLVIKTDSRSLKEVEKAIRKYHPYKIPEVIGWPITWGYQPYLKWLVGSVS